MDLSSPFRTAASSGFRKWDRVVLAPSRPQDAPSVWAKDFAWAAVEFFNAYGACKECGLDDAVHMGSGGRISSIVAAAVVVVVTCVIRHALL